jgi:hypothetical protein
MFAPWMMTLARTGSRLLGKSWGRRLRSAVPRVWGGSALLVSLDGPRPAENYRLLTAVEAGGDERLHHPERAGTLVGSRPGSAALW